MSKRKWAAIRTFPGRDGYYFVKKDMGRVHTRLVSDDPAEAEELRVRIGAKWKEVGDVAEAIALVMGDDPEPSEDEPRTTFEELGRLFLRDKLREGSRKRSGLQTSRVRIDALSKEKWAKKDVAALNFGDIDAWIAKRRRQKRTDGTVQNDLCTASAVLGHARRRGYVERGSPNIFSDCRLEGVSRRERPALDVHRARHFLDIARDETNEETFILMLAGMLTGWRLGDLASLPVANVELDYKVRGKIAPRIVAVRENEKKRRHKVAFLAPSPLLDWLTKRRASSIVGALALTNPMGRRWNSQTVNNQIRKVLLACDAGEIPRWMIDGNDGYTPFTFHGFRHTADSILKHLGVGDHVIDAQLGWQSGARSTMHRHYATAFEEDLIDAAKRLTQTVLGADSDELGATVGATG